MLIPGHILNNKTILESIEVNHFGTYINVVNKNVNGDTFSFHIPENYFIERIVNVIETYEHIHIDCIVHKKFNTSMYSIGELLNIKDGSGDNQGFMYRSTINDNQYKPVEICQLPPYLVY